MKVLNSKSLFIDSHCHVNSFEDPSFEYFEELFAAIDIFEMKPGLDNLNLIRSFSQHGIYVASGVHPLDVYKFNGLTEIESMLSSVINDIDCIGETGIDMFKSNNFDEQFESLKLHIEYARKYDKPIIIHCRGNVDVDLVLRELHGTRFVFHCFGYNLTIANKVIANGGMVSFSGIVTFNNAFEIQEAAKYIDINYMLCETDSPFLAPNPHRGRSNKPIYVSHVYDYIANIRGIDMGVFSEEIKTNFREFINK